MLSANQTITLYSQRYDQETRQTSWTRTIIPGASWYGCQRVTPGEGLKSDDSYSVRVPAEHLPAGFLPRQEYLALEEKTGHWTIQNGDVVVLGTGPELAGGVTNITKQFSDCFTVTAVHTDNLLRPLPHLRLEGK